MAPVAGRGADIDILSQFAGEQECLFPPCTMLVVREDETLAAARRAGDAPRIERLTSTAHAIYGNFAVKDETTNQKKFSSIKVLPTFL